MDSKKKTRITDIVITVIVIAAAAVLGALVGETVLDNII